MDKLSSIKCRYNIDLSKSKKKAQVLRVGGTHYDSVISTTQMMWREMEKELMYEKLLKDIHIQWEIAGTRLEKRRILTMKMR